MKRKSREIKLLARKALQGRYGVVILGLLAVYGLNFVGMILSVQLFSGTDILDFILSEVFTLVVSLLVGIVSAGFSYMLLNIARGRNFSMGDLVYFFKNQPDRVIVAGFVLAVIQLITSIPYYYVSVTTEPGITPEAQIQWFSMIMVLMLLTTVLNFIISVPFAMCYFLMADDPELGGVQALKKSAQLMKRNIWRYICLNISFVPLLFLSVFTFYIALFWIMPYMEMSVTTFYRDLKGELDYRLPGDGYYNGNSFYNGNNYYNGSNFSNGNGSYPGNDSYFGNDGNYSNENNNGSEDGRDDYNSEA